ncbi:hypothetical protein [Terrisporobacter mayombei]|uniref:Uncharacterized protein n=2 Tax=Terrisporobacter mayombei TaxID=1541 RepID=A0ABY9Q1C9_9FIRM|nr:hypothetical protein [Terrisporobacter mayombei]MCC3866789.1 hypothetical protein [Terrisporobacter mayombei]WMT81026.1 hypothetical protein TEMA_13580 [Terrisporobacter mayombei]
MFKKKIGLILILATLGISTIVFVFANKNDNEKITKSPEVSNEKKSEKKSPKNLEDLSIKELTEIRDNEIDKNLEKLKELDIDDDTIKERKHYILDPDWDFGLVGHINLRYKDLTEKDKLIREIQLVRYVNDSNETMDASGAYFKATNEDYQISSYLSKHGRSGSFVSYDNMRFLIQHIDELCKYIDFESYEMVDILNPDHSESFSNDQKKSLNEEWKKVYSKENLNPKLKNQIKSIIK